MDKRLRVAAAAVLPVLLLGCDGILDEPERPTPGAPLEAAIVPGANLVVEADLQAVRRAPIFAVLAAMAQGGPEDEASEEGSAEEPSDGATADGPAPFDEQRFLEAAGLKPGDLISMVASARIDPAELPLAGEGDAGGAAAGGDDSGGTESEGETAEAGAPFDLEGFLGAAERTPAAVALLLASGLDLDRLEKGLRESSEDWKNGTITRVEVGGTPALHARTHHESERGGTWASVLGENTLFVAFNEASLESTLERAKSGALAETDPAVETARSALPGTSQGNLVFLAPESLREMVREQIAKASEDPGAAAMMGFVRPFENLRSIGMGVEAGEDLRVATSYDLGDAAVASQAQAMFGGMLLPMAQAGLAEAAGRSPAEMADRLAIASEGSTLSLVYRMTAEDAAGFETRRKERAAEAEAEAEAELEDGDVYEEEEESGG